MIALVVAFPISEDGGCSRSQTVPENFPTALDKPKWADLRAQGF